MHPVSTPSKHQKTVTFSDVFRGQRKGALETNELIKHGESPDVILPRVNVSSSRATEK